MFGRVPVSSTNHNSLRIRIRDKPRVIQLSPIEVFLTNPPVRPRTLDLIKMPTKIPAYIPTGT